MNVGETVLLTVVGVAIVIPCLLLLVVSGHRGGGTRPIGKVSDTPPRPTPPPPPPTRVVPPWEASRTMTPDVPPIDWSKVDTRGIRSAVQPPSPTGLIPGSPGQEVNSDGDTFIPPLRPAAPRSEDRHYARHEANPRLKDRG